MKNGFIHKAILVLFSGLLLAGCTGGPAKETEQVSSLKVMFWDESYFYREYGDLFAMKHPNIDVEVVATDRIYRDSDQKDFDYDKAFAKFIEEEQPDVLLLNTKQYEKFASEGKLTELDSLIAKDKYNTETIFPAILEILKEKGGGKLYGLSPTFYGSVLYYNADLFAKYGIEAPHDGMSWQEILDTARRFPTDGDEKTRVYGFGSDYGMSLENLASSISSTQGLNYINPDTMKLTLNTDSWKQVYKMAMDALDSKAIYNPDSEGFQGGTMEEYYQSQPFMMGRMAMTVDGSNLLQNLKDAQGQIKDYKPFQIGAVAGPVDPAEPDKSRNISMSEILAVRANSANADAAWEFLKFVNGEEFAKIKSRTLNGGLMSRMGVQKEYNGVSLDVFYKLKPKLDNDSDNYDKIPDSFHEKYYSIFSREMKLVQDKKKSIDEALQTVQDEGQAALDKAVQDEAAGKKDEPDAEADQAG
ncbi:extracellular solute-binding protein [Paenibacillus macerans]|uniref:ABC transporter substrate-binding protein n=1 Tax=Paenibacillus macerans TaxID=44252 RepID=UPI001F0F8A0E|nr:extracellular solute-binding protein [Paenibacillus macerans]UMV48107.1 extracellular solute-binding protein [Paenibacillus macerans]